MVFVAACMVEVVLVTLQAWRKVPSHLNRDTSFDSVKGVTLERTVSATVAYNGAGWLKPAHAVPMQAIVVLVSARTP